MGSPIPDDKREAIAADIEAGQLSRNAIARKHGVSAGTVTNIAREREITGAFDRAATKDATAARRADMAKDRARISAKFLARAEEALDDMDQPHIVYAFGGRENTYNEQTLPCPPSSDRRNLMTIAAIGLQRHLEAERHDAAAEQDEVGSLLGTLFDRLRDRHGDGT